MRTVRRKQRGATRNAPLWIKAGGIVWLPMPVAGAWPCRRFRWGGQGRTNQTTASSSIDRFIPLKPPVAACQALAHLVDDRRRGGCFGFAECTAESHATIL